MAELHLFIEVDTSTVRRIEDTVRGQGCSVAVVEDAVFQPPSGRQVLVVSSYPVGARFAAKVDRARVEQLLERASISFDVIGEDTAAPIRASQRGWDVEWKPAHHRGFRGWVAGVVGGAPGSSRSRVSSWLLSAHRTVYADTAVAARRRSEQLHRARGGTGSSGTRVSPRPLPAGGVRSPSQAPQVFGGLNMFIPYGWAVLLVVVTAVLAIVLAVVAWPRWVAVSVALGWVVVHAAARWALMRRVPGAGRAKLTEIWMWSAAVVLVLFGAVALRSLQQQAGPGFPLALPVLLSIALPGVAVQLKLWGAGRFASWAIPLLAAGAASFAPVLGLLMYLSYTQALGVPYDALTITTLEQAWAGANTMAVWLLAATIFAGVIGVVQWWAGRNLTALGLCAAFLILSLVVVLVSSSTKADRAARTVDERGVPVDWYAITPQLVCVTSRDDGKVTPVFGPPFDATVPHVLLGDADGRWLLWQAPDVYWTVEDTTVSVAPIASSGTC